MSIRHQAVTPFNDSEGPSTYHELKKWGGKDPSSIKVKSNMSRHPMSGVDDPLHAALAARTPVLPRDEHRWSHSTVVRPTGAHYSPAGEFGSRSRVGAGRGVYSYGGNRHSAIPGNAVGSPPNRRGGSAIPGHPSNRPGQNAIGNPPHRRGENAVGNPPNRIGENALASGFSPRFGKSHGHRV